MYEILKFSTQTRLVNCMHINKLPSSLDFSTKEYYMQLSLIRTISFSQTTNKCIGKNDKQNIYSNLQLAYIKSIFILLYNNELQDKDAEAVQDALVNDYGVVINECTPEDKKELISMCESFYENGAAYGWSDGLYEEIQNIIK